MYQSKQYRDWVRAADQYGMAQKVGTYYPLSTFTAEVLLAHGKARGDADNYVKAVLDWAQRACLITNDKFSRKVTVEWVRWDRAPHGCKLILTGESA